MNACPRCHGTGKVAVIRRVGVGVPVVQLVPCELCDETGYRELGAAG